MISENSAPTRSNFSKISRLSAAVSALLIFGGCGNTESGDSRDERIVDFTSGVTLIARNVNPDCESNGAGPGEFRSILEARLGDGRRLDRVIGVLWAPANNVTVSLASNGSTVIANTVMLNALVGDFVCVDSSHTKEKGDGLLFHPEDTPLREDTVCFTLKDSDTSLDFQLRMKTGDCTLEANVLAVVTSS